MPLTRRDALKLLAGAVPAFSLGRTLGAGAMKGAPAALNAGPEIPPGPFHGTRASLAGYRIPEWFRDAKFGIWAHWGPQSAIEDGDWYARNMYIQGSRQYDDHVANYGHPSKTGYKDLIPIWKAERFDPEFLVGLYKKAGAKYFMSMGVHHDNFDLWNSRHTRWNSVNMGPHQDVVGLFRQAAQNHGLRFAVSDHLWISYKWFSSSKGGDHSGPLAGVPYDGVDPQYADLYGSCAKVYVPDLQWNDEGVPVAWKHQWFRRIRDLVEHYEPDLLYCDGPIPFEDWGLALVAHFYNLNAARHGGRLEAVYTSKRNEDSAGGACVLDVERGLVDRIWPEPWQTDTCIGDWHYRRGIKYKTPKTVIDMLVDIVSRNGNLMLNFPLPNSGKLDDEELKVLAGITAWMAVNAEAIHGTRPWKICGEGPALRRPPPARVSMSEKSRPELTAADVRYTTKGAMLYAFFMGWPENGEAVFPALASARGLVAGKVAAVELLGFGPVRWTLDGAGLRVRVPEQRPCDYGCALKLTGTGLV